MHASECVVQILQDSAVILCGRFLHSETLCLCPQSVPAAAAVVWWEHSWVCVLWQYCVGWSWWLCPGCCYRREAGHQVVLLRMETFTALQRLALNSQVNRHSHRLTCPWSSQDIVNVRRPLKPGVRNLSPLLSRYSCILHFLSTPSSPSTVFRFVTLYDVQHRWEQGHFTGWGGGDFQNYVSLNWFGLLGNLSYTYVCGYY